MKINNTRYVVYTQDMLELIRTDSENEDFRTLVHSLDAYLAKMNGEADAFYSQFNKIAALQHVIVAYSNGVPVGCGAFKPFEDKQVEVKRMFVDPTARNQGIATKILSELELWAKELNYASCVLETGTFLKEAVNLYQSRGYSIIPNYGQYIGVEDSVCMRKNV